MVAAPGTFKARVKGLIGRHERAEGTDMLFVEAKLRRLRIADRNVLSDQIDGDFALFYNARRSIVAPDRKDYRRAFVVRFHSKRAGWTKLAKHAPASEFVAGRDVRALRYRAGNIAISEWRFSGPDALLGPSGCGRAGQFSRPASRGSPDVLWQSELVCEPIAEVWSPS
jgi:hypothetical protein